MKLKIVCFSDIHGQIDNNLTDWFNSHPGDILIFAGDQKGSRLEDGSKFASWITNLPYKYKVIVFGNHDDNYKNVQDYCKKYKNIIFLYDELINLYGINIYGSPYSVAFGNWVFQKSDKDLIRLYDSIPDSTNILITHTPAYGILDKTIFGYNEGSRSLLDRIDKLPNLKYHISGHIHEGGGKYVDYEKQRVYINASLLNEQYKLVRMPYAFIYKK